MLKSRYIYSTLLAALLLLLMSLIGLEAASDDVHEMMLTAQNLDLLPDSLNKDIFEGLNDTTTFRDSIKINVKSRSGLDTVVIYSGKDSVVMNLKSRVMRLRGNAKLEMKDQKLEAEVIELNFDENTLSAEGLADSNKKIIGFPHFTEKGEEYFGEKIKYNFKTKKGLITLGETEMGEGFYFGSKIKRVSENELFVQNGFYTTCDAPHPHFYFGSPEMKVVVQDRIFLDPIILFVEDMPLFAVPLGLFFPNKGGRQSGLIIPTFFFSNNRGVVLNNLGIYLALSDYYDTQIGIDFFSKGGFILKNNSRYKLLNEFDGDLRIEWGKTRLNPEDSYETRYSIGLNHNQKLDPFSTITARLDFRSQDYNRNTSFNLNDVIQQNVSSNASYSTRFENGSSFSVSFQRDQNIIDDTYDQVLPNVTFSLPNLYPLKKLVAQDNWMKDITMSYSVSALKRDSKKKEIKFVNDSTRDTNIVNSYKASIRHSPGISISPKLGYFTVQPSISFSANNYFRRLTRTYNEIDSSTSDTFENGFFTEYTYSLGLSLQTTLYGIADDKNPFLLFLKPSYLGIKAFRHTYQPRLSYSFRPDQSSSSDDFFGKYYDTKQNTEVVYSRFEADDGGIASRKISQSINYSDIHRFAIKLPGIDTLPDKNLDLLELNFSTGYDFEKDSLNLDRINMSFRSPALNFINFSGRASLNLYDEAEQRDIKTGELNGIYRDINQFLIRNGKGLFRMTSLNFEMSTSFSSEGIVLESEFGRESAQDTIKDTTSSLGSRFMQRMQYTSVESDIFGDNSPGYSKLNLPWSLTFGLSYNYNKQNKHSKSESINFRANFAFSLTPTWQIDIGGQYDFIEKELLSPSVNITKDLHCWELVFNWYPTGFNQGFFLRFGVKSSMLSDLKIEKRSSYLYR